MGITGNLQTMQLPELLQWLSQGKKTGTLVVDDGRFEKRVYLRAGNVVSSSSSDPREYLGQFLVAQGYIGEEELAGAIRMQEQTGMLLGKVLTSIGSVEEADLERLLRLKAEETIFDLFAWEQGDFRFLDDELPERPMVPIELDVTGLVLEGVRRLDEWQRIRERIPSSQAVPVAIGGFDDLDLTPGERQVLEQVDDGSTVEQIRRRAKATDFFVHRALFEAARAGRLKLVLPAWERGEVAPPAEPAASGGDPFDARALLAAAGPHLAAGRYDLALRRLRAAHELEPDDREIRDAVARAETDIRQRLAADGVVPEAVPRLAVGLEELTASNLTRNQGFILSRVNGSYDVAEIVKISSLGELEAMLVFWSLAQAGHLTLGDRKKKRA